MRTLILILICAVSVGACTTREERPVISNKVNDNVEIQILTSQIKQLNKEEYQHPQTRRSRFSDRQLSVLYSDAYGYLFGRIFTTQVNDCLARTAIEGTPTTSTTEPPTATQSELITFIQL